MKIQEKWLHTFFIIFLLSTTKLLSNDTTLKIPFRKVLELEQHIREIIKEHYCLKDKVNTDSLLFFHIYLMGSNTDPDDTNDFINNLIFVDEPREHFILCVSYVFTQKSQLIGSYGLLTFTPYCEFIDFTKKQFTWYLQTIKALRDIKAKIVFQFLSLDVLAYYVITEDNKVTVYRIRSDPEISKSDNKDTIEIMTLNAYRNWKLSKSKH